MVVGVGVVVDMFVGSGGQNFESLSKEGCFCVGFRRGLLVDEH